MNQVSTSADELFAEVEPFVEETVASADELRELALDVNELLAELEASSPHPRLGAAYADARVAHVGLNSNLLALLEESNSLLQDFDRELYRRQGSEVVEAFDRLGDADVQTLERLGAVVPVLEPVRDRVFAAPDKIFLAVMAVLISPSPLVRWHYDALSGYLRRPSKWQRLTEGVGKLLKAAVVDAGGAVVPFLGTAEVLCQLSATQMSKDRERLKSANDEISRLFFFTDHLADITQGVETAKDNAKRAKEFIAEANRGFDEDCAWLIEMAPPRPLR